MTDAKRVMTRRRAVGLSLAGAAAPPSPAGAQRRSPDQARTQAKRPALLGVYVGNSPEDVPKFERWLGREIDGVLGYTGGSSWDEIRSPGWFTDLWSRIDRPVFWSVPLVPSNDRNGLRDAAKGGRNAEYRDAARRLASFRPRDERVFVRTGWEFNGDWFPWSAAGHEKAFIGAFRHFVDSFRAMSNRFQFDWCVNMGGSKTDPERCYPGDAHVDIVGMDFYWNTEFWSDDPVEAWDRMMNDERGLRWHRDFAARRGKPIAFSEWGVTTDNAAPFLERAKAWFDSNDVVYQTYWDTNADYPGKLSDGKFPKSASAYTRLFSQNRPQRRT